MNVLILVMPNPEHESIERLRKEVERLKNLLEMANVRIAHSKKESLALLSWMARLEKLLQPAGKAGPNEIAASLMLVGRGRALRTGSEQAGALEGKTVAEAERSRLQSAP